MITKKHGYLFQFLLVLLFASCSSVLAGVVPCAAPFVSITGTDSEAQNIKVEWCNPNEASDPAVFTIQEGSARSGRMSDILSRAPITNCDPDSGLCRTTL